MSDNHTTTLWWVDTENVTVVTGEYPGDPGNTTGRHINNVTHFDNERGAWDALGAEVTARVIATGRAVANAEESLLAAPDRGGNALACAQATHWDCQCRAATAARNFALYPERRQEWQRQVDQALRARATELAPVLTPATAFQRGDIVEVTFTSGFSYRGIVRSVRRGEVYVITRGSGHSYNPADTQITLIERRGRRKAATLHAWAQAFE